MKIPIAQFGWTAGFNVPSKNMRKNVLLQFWSRATYVRLGCGLMDSYSLVPRPCGRREKWPGVHCLTIRERLRKSSTNESDYGQVTRGCYEEK